MISLLYTAVLVRKFDVSSRDRSDSVIYKSKLRKDGARVISITENVGDGNDGNLIEAICEAMELFGTALREHRQRYARECRIKCRTWVIGKVYPHKMRP